MIAAYDSSGQGKWEAVWGAGVDQLVEFLDLADTEAYVPLTDHRNTVVGTWSVTDGAVDELAQYNPHGRLTLFNATETEKCREQSDSGISPLPVCENPSGLPFGFASAYRSQTSGLIFMRNRWYSPRLAQFITRDPLGYVDSYNPYAYVGFDPINFWDPYGAESSPTDNADDEGPNAFERLLDAAFPGTPGDRTYGQTVQETLKIIGADFELSEDGSPGGSIHGGNPGGMGNPNTYLIDALLTFPHLVSGAAGKAAKFGMRLLRNQKDRLARLAQKTIDDVADALKRRGTRLQADNACPGGRCPPGRDICFVAGTPVVMCDGTLESIEDVEQGDWVWSKDEETGEEGCRKVVGLKVTPDQPVIDLETQNAAGQSEVLGVTAEHPFWVVGHGWKAAGELVPGDEIYTSRGGWVRVSGATWTTDRQTVYNFEVEGFHTYFVGESRAWVHNTCSDPEILNALGDIEDGVPRHNVRNPKPFRNDGRGGSATLPERDSSGNPISYTEHTVNPRPPGGKLDGKRIVIGSDGSKYWTDDHFSSFHEF